MTRLNPSLKLSMEVLLVLLIAMLICNKAHSQVIPKSKQFKQQEAMADMLQQNIFDYCASADNTAPVITNSKAIGKDPVAGIKKPVPPTMQTTVQHNSSRGTGVRQTIVFTGAGNTKLVTTIRIR